MHTTALSTAHTTPNNTSFASSRASTACGMPVMANAVVSPPSRSASWCAITDASTQGNSAA